MPDTGVEGGKVRRGNGDLVFIGDSFSLGMKNPGDEWLWELYNKVNVLSTSELYTG